MYYLVGKWKYCGVICTFIFVSKFMVAGGFLSDQLWIVLWLVAERKGSHGPGHASGHPALAVQDRGVHVPEHRCRHPWVRTPGVFRTNAVLWLWVYNECTVDSSKSVNPLSQNSCRGNYRSYISTKKMIYFASKIQHSSRSSSTVFKIFDPAPLINIYA